MTDQTANLSPLDLKPNAASNLRVVFICLGVVFGMLGLAYAAVPLYQIFCQVTGFGGTTQRAEGNGLGIIDREMTTRFDANVSSSLNWTVEPASSSLDKIGTIRTVNYIATNNSSVTLTGTAGFNVVPEIMGYYFNKIECFCFIEQTLAPGESVEMPVTFFIDPELAHDAELDTINDVTLSYTFYATENGSS